MKKGGYLIIDLLNHKLSDTPVIIEGIYNAIADNDEKMLLISGMMEDDILYDDMVGFAVPNDDVIEVTVGTKKLTITVDDEVTISNAGGGGGGSVNVVNSLTSDSTSDALSAKQGKVLKGLVDGKLPINQGSENAGKYMKVADDGSVEYAAGGGGGSISVIDNLTSDSSTDALSAKQGKALKTLIDTESGTRLSADVTLEIEIDNINASADPWDNSKAYVKGDLVLYSSKLFMCVTNNTNQAPAEGTYWTRVSLGNFGGFQFRDNNGVAEYRKSGADTWAPFRSGGGSNPPVLIYENQDRTQAITSFDIPFDFSGDYNAIIVTFAASRGQERRPIVPFILKGSTVYISGGSGTRAITVSDSQVSVGVDTQSGAYDIPYKIYALSCPDVDLS